MLGSHNSMSGYPCPWYLKPFNVFAKCQSLTLAEQFQAGVRFFDIRLKVKPDGRYCVAHGLMRYKTHSYIDMLGELKRLAELHGADVHYRVMLEYNKKPHELDAVVWWFKRAVEAGCAACGGLRFCGGYQKWNYALVVNADDGCDLPITHKYSSVLGWRRFVHCVPRIYAKKHNAEFKEEYKATLDAKDAVLLLDFAQEGRRQD